MLWHWAKRRHPDKSKHWILTAFFVSVPYVILTSSTSSAGVATPDPTVKRRLMAEVNILNSRCNNSCPEGCAGKCASLRRQE